jgi:hypothetical protein
MIVMPDRAVVPMRGPAIEVVAPVSTEKRPMRRRRGAKAVRVEEVEQDVWWARASDFDRRRVALAWAWAIWSGRALDRISRVDLSQVPPFSLCILASIHTECALAIEATI